MVAPCSSGCISNHRLPHTHTHTHTQRFAAVIMRIRDPKTTALIFASGKMVCTGAKSEEDSRMAARKVGTRWVPHACLQK